MISNGCLPDLVEMKVDYKADIKCLDLGVSTKKIFVLGKIQSSLAFMPSSLPSSP